MKNLLLLLSLFLLFSVAPVGSATRSSVQSNETVYICTGKYATSYHVDKECAAGNCKATVKAVSRAEAVQMGRKPCGRCN